ncbi:MAG: hypothetical protein ABEJ95_07395 [Candidatus Nanohalobium sp.]
MGKLEEIGDMYKKQIDGFQKGDIEEEKVVEKVRELNSLLKDMKQKIPEKKYLETEDSKKAYEKFKKNTETENCLKDLSEVAENLNNRFTETVGEIRSYKNEFTSENLDVDILEFPERDYGRAEFNQKIECFKSEQVRKRQNDANLPFINPEEEIPDMDEARENIREATPRDSKPYEGHPEEDLEENRKSIQEHREKSFR